MRETSFIKQNKDKWKEFERVLEHQDTDPDKLNDLFIQITDDLSYSRTFYPNRSVRVYLNNLAQKIFYSIYKNKKNRLGRLISFWTDELPQLVYEARKDFKLSFLVFLLAFIIGAFSSIMDPEFPRAILGDDYIDMTLENIESGDPMAVYKQRGEFGMALSITANNLFVAFLTFVLGVFFAIGSIAIMLSNGIMVGAFQYFFYEQGVFWESFLAIWTHGTLEISAIIIAGAAGITMGKGLVFPGTYSRIQSFQISARRGLKIMLGIAPIIILAGFIEGYLTRYTETPDFIRFLFILVCLFFVLFYYVWYPRKKAKIGFQMDIKDTKIQPDHLQVINFDRIKSSGEIFADTFLFFNKHLQYILWAAVFAALSFCSISFLLASEAPSDFISFPTHFLGMMISLKQFFINEANPLLPFFNILIFTALSFLSYTLLIKSSKEQQTTSTKKVTRTQHVINFLKTLVPISLFFLILITKDWYTPFIFTFVSPVLLLWTYIMYEEGLGIFQGLGRAFSLMGSGNYGRTLGTFLLMSCVAVIFFMILDTQLVWFFIERISWNVAIEENSSEQVVTIIGSFILILTSYLIFSYMIIGIGLLYHSLLEIKEAPNLQERIKQIGMGQRIQGMEKET